MPLPRLSLTTLCCLPSFGVVCCWQLLGVVAKTQINQNMDANATCVSSKIMHVHVASQLSMTRHCGGGGGL